MKDKLYQIDNILMRLEDYIHGKDGDDITKARKNVMDLLKIIDITANEAKVFSSNAMLKVTSDSTENKKESEVAVCPDCKSIKIGKVYEFNKCYDCGNMW